MPISSSRKRPYPLEIDQIKREDAASTSIDSQDADSNQQAPPQYSAIRGLRNL